MQVLSLGTRSAGVDMDVSVKKLTLAVVSVSFVACAKKTTSQVFPENQNFSSSQCASQRVPNQFIVHWEDGSMTFEKAENSEQFVQSFVEPNLQQIQYVEFDRWVTIDNTYDSSAKISATDSPDYTSWGQEKIEAQQVWNQNVFGEGVEVAVVDTAVDYSHPQLKSRISINQGELNGKPNIDDDNNGYVDDLFGWDFINGKTLPVVDENDLHGSHVAGIIAAEHEKGMIKGLAPKAKILPVNFMNESSGTISDAIKAIRYAAGRNVKVINASWGGPCTSDVVGLKSAVADLEKQNILFVAAAGNDGVVLDNAVESKKSYPAMLNLPNQITVAWTRANDFLDLMSNVSSNYVHLGAPGGNIYSTVPDGYASLSGTSMAAPFVSGTAALLWSAHPNASVAQVKQAILGSVDVMSDKGYSVQTQGRLNAKSALEYLSKVMSKP